MYDTDSIPSSHPVKRSFLWSRRDILVRDFFQLRSFSPKTTAGVIRIVVLITSVSSRANPALSGGASGIIRRHKKLSGRGRMTCVSVRAWFNLFHLRVSVLFRPIGASVEGS